MEVCTGSLQYAAHKPAKNKARGAREILLIHAPIFAITKSYHLRPTSEG